MQNSILEIIIGDGFGEFLMEQRANNFVLRIREIILCLSTLGWV